MMPRPWPWTPAWGVLGVAATFVEAIWRLGERAAMELSGDLDPVHWIVFAVATVVMTYGEGYLALQRRFAPAVIARSFELPSRARWTRSALAPLYAISVIGAPARTAARAGVGILAIIGCVLVVREFAAPWRGIVDGAVAVALSWGLLAMLVQLANAFVAHGALRGRALPARDIS